MGDGVQVQQGVFIGKDDGTQFFTIQNAVFDDPREPGIDSGEHLHIGAEQIVGSIETGKQADFVVCTPDYSQRRVFIAGKEIQ